MKTTRAEIHALHQLVVLLMFSLDRLFNRRVDGWRACRKGFRLEIRDYGIPNQKNVHIHPVGLPKNDYVVCRFENYDKRDGNWIPTEGGFSPDHSALEIRDFRFDGTLSHLEYMDPEVIIRPRNPKEKEKFKQILERPRGPARAEIF